MKKIFYVIAFIFTFFNIPFALENADVNLFTGMAAHEHSLFVLSGRGGMDINLGINYHSPVENSAWERNDKVQLSRFGFGWDMNFGSIISNHKNTVNIDDDQYYWHLTDGSICQIVKITNANATVAFMVENHPYWKITQHILQTGTPPNIYNIVTGWTIVDENGKTHIYGDISKPPVSTIDKRNSTEYTFSWGASGYVGGGTAQNPELYPYRWDISKSSDKFGNEIQYLYEQKTEKLWNSTLEYTKCSYLKRITNPEGAYVVFEGQPKKQGEYYDPYTSEKEPDGFQEFLDTALVKTISIFTERNELMYKFDFCFKKIRENVKDKIGEKFFVKSLLAEIIKSNKIKVVSRFVFDYYDDENESQKNPENYNFGALKSIQTDVCGKLTYEYKQIKLPGDIKKFNKFGEPFSLYEQFYRSAGLTSDGKEFVIIGADKKVFLYQWTGTKWKEMKIGDFQSGSTLGVDRAKGVMAGIDYFIVNCYDNRNPFPNKILAFNWNGAEWVKTLEKDYYSVWHTQIFPATKYFVVHDNLNKKLHTFYWDSQKWIESDKSIIDNIAPANMIYSNDYFAYHLKDNSNMHVFTWNGRTNQFESSTYEIKELNNYMLQSNVSSVNNSILTYQDKSMLIYSWDGVKWNATYSEYDKNGLKPYIGNNYMSIISNNSAVKIFQWNGKDWEYMHWVEDIMDNEIPEPYHGPDALGFPGQDYFFVSYPHVKCQWGWHFLGLGMIDYYRYSSVRAYNFFNNDWYDTYTGQFGNEKQSKKFLNGTDYGVCVGGLIKNNRAEMAFSPEFPVKWNGKTWQKENVDIVGESYFSVGEVIASIVQDKWGSCFPLSDNVFVSGNETEIDIYRKINGSFDGDVKTYVVSKTKLNDAINGVDIVTNFVYNTETSTFDTRGNVPKFNKVETSTLGAGKTVRYFFNGYNSIKNNEQSVKNPEYDKLNGAVYLTEQYNDNGNLLSKTETEYSIYHNGGWPSLVNDIRFTKSTETKLGIAKTVEYSDYDNLNGHPTTIITNGSNGKKTIEKRTYAFNRYSGMGPTGANILTPLSQVVLYEDVADPLHAKYGQTITWNNTKCPGKWAKDRSFLWKGNGGFQSFWDNTSVWQANEEILKYDLYGTPVETTIPGTSLFSIIETGNFGTQVTATIKNASYDECAVLTGDVDENSGLDTYYDVSNKWKKGGTYLTSSRHHFGTNCIMVPSGAAGVSTNIHGIDPNKDKDYLFTAWVYTETACDQNHYILLNLEKVPAREPLPIDVKFTSLPSGSANGVGWQMIKAVIPGNALNGLIYGDAASYFKVNLSGVLISFYVDDIRFSPVDAIVNTYYSDALWKKTITEVDENGKSVSTIYDDQGRLASVFNNKGVLLSKLAYGNAMCNTQIGDGSLALLMLTAGAITDELDTKAAIKVYNVNYDNNIENVVISAAAKHEDGRSRYRINDGSWIELLCPCDLEFILSLLSGEQKKVDIEGIAPSGIEADNIRYTIYIKRNANCWAIMGDVLSSNRIRECQLFTNNQNKQFAAYIEKNGSLNVKEYGIGGWVTLPRVAVNAENISAAFMGDKPILCYIDLNNNRKAAVKQYTAGTWSSITGLAEFVSPSEAQDPVCVYTSSGVPYVAYIGNLNDEPGYSGNDADERVIVKKFINGAWISATGDNSKLAVSSESAKDINLKISPLGVLYLAYIAVGTDKDNNANDEDGKVIVKQLNGNQWVQVGDYISGPTGSCDQLDLTFVNNMPCVIYAEAALTVVNGVQTFKNSGYKDLNVKVFDQSRSWLPPFRSNIPQNYSHWVHLGSQSVCRLTNEDVIKMTSDGTNLYLLFQNTDNAHKLTVLNWNGTNWNSLINPGFADCGHQNSQSILSILKVDNSLYVSYPNGNKDDLVNINSFNLNESCSDATICDLQISGNGYVIEPEFKKYILNYEMEVDNSVNEITLSAVPCTPGTEIKVLVNGQESTLSVELSVGSNLIVLQATAADGTTRTTYTLNVTRKASSFASLCSFQVYSEATIGTKTIIDYTPIFDQNVLEYSIQGYYTGEYIYISPVNDGNSTIFVNGVPTNTGSVSEAISVKYGQNKFIISVIASDGITKKIYCLNVNKEVPTNIGLAGIIPSSGVLQPNFSMQTFNYNIAVESSVNEIKFTPTTNGAVISCKNTVIPSGQLSQSLPLNIGNNIFSFVTKNSGIDKGAAYYVTVTRKPTVDVQLSSLVIYNDYATPQQVILSPAFSSEVLNYSAMVPDNVKGLRIIPTASDPTNSLIELLGSATVITSGSEAFSTIDAGVNQICINITNGTNVASYNINVVKDAAPIASKSNIYFQKGTIDYSESDGTVLIPVNLNKIVSSQVSVKCSVVSGTATNGADYNISSGTLIFDKCTQQQYISMTINDDNIVEPDETIKLKLEDPLPAGSVQISGTGEFECKIHDNDFPVVSFSTVSSLFPESIGNAEILVSISTPTYQPITVSFDVVDLTTITNADFTISNRKIVFNPGDPTSKAIPVSIVNDIIIENNEVFNIKLMDADNGSLGSKIFHTVTITDDEVPLPNVKFSSSVGSGLESFSNPVINVIIDRAPGTGQIVTVPYFVSGGTATNGVDYDLPTGALTFTSTTLLSQNIPITIINNSIGEGIETVRIKLGSPIGGAVLGTPDEFTYTITENENRVIFVDKSATGIIHDGKSWSTAYRHPQDAISDAYKDQINSAVDIWVADGEYSGVIAIPSYPIVLNLYRDLSVDQPVDINLYGGFKGDELYGGENLLSQRNFFLNKVFLKDNTAQLIHAYFAKKVTIDGCYFSGGSSSYIKGNDNTFTITNCFFDDIRGSIDCEGESTDAKVIISNSQFKNCINKALYITDNVAVINCKFEDNSSTPVRINSTCSGNVDIINCEFLRNQTSTYGGAIWLHCLNRIGTNTYIRISNCIFNDNRAIFGGGAVVFENPHIKTTDVNFEITNCTFTNNWTRTIGGGAIYTFEYCPLTISNSIFFNNTIGLNQTVIDDIVNASDLTLYNTNYQSVAFLGSCACPAVTYNCNTVNPLLNSGLRPQSAECINHGDATKLPADIFDLDNDDNTSEPIPYDIIGNNRIISNVDMGAYEQ